jgi:2-dehydro-3-deoxyphosphogluconate aldolase/(4S)-4-hydroxy-2-oxoglutarate aldolase
MLEADDVLARIGELKVVPIVAVRDASDAPALADALVAGGLPCAEITFRTDAAAEAMGAIAARGDVLVGAGSVVSVEQVKAATDAGASFIVSPGFSPRVVECCVRDGYAVTPGTCTATDIMAAMEFGLDVVEFFPAEAMGGPRILTAVGAPLPGVRFIPTGGICA